MWISWLFQDDRKYEKCPKIIAGSSVNRAKSMNVVRKCLDTFNVLFVTICIRELWEKMLPEDSKDRMDTKGH